MKNILILGGGDGLPARQVLRHPGVEHITMVDIDGEWVDFTRTNPYTKLTSQDALNDPRVDVHISDAFRWVARAQQQRNSYDAILIDFPESVNLAAIRVVSIQFLNDLKRIVSEQGVVVIQNDFHVPFEVVKHIWKTARTVGFYPLFGFRRDPTVFSDPIIVQYALFKNKEAFDFYRQKYQTEYLKSPRYKRIMDRYGYFDYTTDVPEGSEWISYYDPEVGELLKFYLTQ